MHGSTRVGSTGKTLDWFEWIKDPWPVGLEMMDGDVGGGITMMNENRGNYSNVLFIEEDSRDAGAHVE